MVLSNIGLKEALNNRDIIITEYTWANNKANETPSKPISKDFDYSKLKGGHKIRLHVGFLARTLSKKKWINPKHLYNNRDGIIDLRCLNERKYNLLPGESVLIYTNEVVTLGSCYFGIIFSRVSLEEKGLVVSDSYIDPNWSGVLQLIVTNDSESPLLLQEHCEIANLVIFKMDNAENENVNNRNEHYGVTWETISENPSYPKWDDRKRSIFSRIRHTFRTHWIAFTAIGLVGIVAIISQTITVIINVLKVLFK